MSRAVVTALRENMRRALTENRLQEAEDILTRLKQEDPLSQETRGFELELCLNSNRLSEATALARQLRRLFPESARIFFLAGKLAYRLKDYKEAQSYFRESHRLFPSWWTEWWLGKALTQSGSFEEAESLLLSVRERNDKVLLDLAWLYERKHDPATALKYCEEFLAIYPNHSFVIEQQVRIKASLAEPDSLIEEVGTLAELGEEVSSAVFPAYVQKLFETGNTVEARARIVAKMGDLDSKTASKVAWICYRAQAYDLACTLFLSHLHSNVWYYKSLNALESAAAKCSRIAEVMEAYRACATEVPSLYGRLKSLSRRNPG
jgi:tetratricopeptide (TPR) repeat protein